MQVLLIDDDPLVHQVINVFLQRFGLESSTEIAVKALQDPVQGLLEISENGDSYDLVLLDLKLPKLSGDEIYRSIARNAPYLMERIIFITASPDKLHYKLPGLDLRVLGKPFRYEMFAFHVEDIARASMPGSQTG